MNHGDLFPLFRRAHQKAEICPSEVNLPMEPAISDSVSEETVVPGHTQKLLWIEGQNAPRSAKIYNCSEKSKHEPSHFFLGPKMRKEPL